MRVFAGEDSIEMPQRAGVSAVHALLAVNIAVYFLQLTVLSADGVAGALGLDPARMPGAWWTLMSYMFVHVSLWHLAANMVTLWMFGTRLEQAWAKRSFVYFYFWCGVGGAVAHLLFSGGAMLVGASAGVSGVMLAYAMRWPDEEVFLFGMIPMKSRWLILWMVGVNVAIGLSADTMIGWKAHLGGLAFGWLFLQAAAVGGVESMRRLVSAVPDDPDEMPHAVPRIQSRVKQRTLVRDEVVARSNAIAPARQTAPAERDTPAEKRARVNMVLDKISRDGMNSLSDEERKLLDDASRMLRDG